MKKLIQISICLMILILNMHTVKAMNYQAQIQDHYYESFQEAIKDILDEKQKGPIYLLDDVILDIGTINKDIEIIGNHHQISVPCQSQTNDSESQGRLNIQAHLINVMYNLIICIHLEIIHGRLLCLQLVF